MPRNSGIDCLRGLSMLLVLILHYCQELPHDFSSLNPDYVLGVVINGHYGVRMFFVISGFLIASNTLKRYGRLSDVSIREFYIMRASRILPLFLLLLAVLSALGYARVRGFAVEPEHSIAQMVWYAVTLRFNLYFIHFTGWEVLSWGILWSLSIEEVFYLAFPLLCRISRWTPVAALLFGLLFCYGWYFRSVPGNQPWDYFGCFDMMALGVLTALAAATSQGRHLPGRFRVPLAAAGLALIVAVHQGPPLLDNVVWGPSLLAVGTAMALLACGNGPAPAAPLVLALPTAPLRLLGRYSYECYLLHASAILAIQSWLWQWGDRPYFYLAMTFAIVLAASVALGWLVGEPSNRWLRGFLTARLVPAPADRGGKGLEAISSPA
jgi:peptidoglycan/LPS O-acetylase OafA/YrhL